MFKKALIAAAIWGATSVAYAETTACNYSTDFDIKIDEVGVKFHKDGKKSVEFQNDRLLIDGKTVTLNDAQIAATRSLQQGAREMVPKIAEVAVEGAELGIKASTMVLTALFGDDEAMHQELIAPIEALSDKIQANINKTQMNTAELEKAFESAFDEEFEQVIEKAALKYSGKIVGNILSAVFSGDDEEVKDFEFRMENMERDIEKYVEANAKGLEEKAEALCQDIAALEKFDSVLESIDGYPENGIIQKDGQGLNVKGLTWNHK